MWLPLSGRFREGVPLRKDDSLVGGGCPASYRRRFLIAAAERADENNTATNMKVNNPSKDICYPEALGSEFVVGVAGGKFGKHFLCFASLSKAQIGGCEVPACFCKVGSIVILRACRVECGVVVCFKFRQSFLYFADV